MVYQDLGLSMKVLLGMLGVINNELHGWDAGGSIKINLGIEVAPFFILYALYLQVGEVLLIEASDLVRRSWASFASQAHHIL